MAGAKDTGYPRPPIIYPEAIAVLVVPLFGALGYLVFPTDLAFLTRLIAIALLVLSLDLVTGYCGVATLGQASLFGISAYIVGNACLSGLSDPIVLLLVGIATGIIAGIISGALITRFSGLPQLVISIAFGELVYALANKMSWLTGGSDGLAGISPSPVLGIFAFDLYSKTAFGFSLAVFAIVLLFLLRFVRSPFGLTCLAIKDDPLRARMIGVAAYARLVVMYGVSGGIAGVGGALMAMTAGVVGLDSVTFERSALALVMLVLGGAGNIWGAVVGAVVFQTFAEIVGATSPFQWMTIVGAVLIAIVMFAPRGLSYGTEALWRKLLGRGQPG